jgi:hypothetical protein
MYRSENDKYMFTCLFFYGIDTTNGEDGISGSRYSPCLMSPILGTTRRAQRQKLVNFGIVVNNFKFD